MTPNEALARYPDLAGLDTDGLFVELSTLTGLSRREWSDVLQAPPSLQAMILANYRDQNWAAPGSSALDRVLAVLVIIGTIAGVVGGVAGATSAVSSLRGL